MLTAYFLTVTIVSIWIYFQVRATARGIRVARRSLPCAQHILSENGQDHALALMPCNALERHTRGKKPAAGDAAGT